MKLEHAVAVFALSVSCAMAQDGPVRLRVKNALDAVRPEQTVELTVAALSGRSRRRTCRSSPSPTRAPAASSSPRPSTKTATGSSTGWCSRPTSRPARR